jgi:hypothetical protein
VPTDPRLEAAAAAREDLRRCELAIDGLHEQLAAKHREKRALGRRVLALLDEATGHVTPPLPFPDPDAKPARKRRTPPPLPR